MKNQFKVTGFTFLILVSCLSLGADIEKFAVRGSEDKSHYEVILDNDSNTITFLNYTPEQIGQCTGNFAKEIINVKPYPYYLYNISVHCYPFELSLIVPPFNVSGTVDGLITSKSFFGKTLPVKISPTW